MDEDGRKHLEFIQSVISRMAANSFTLKSWSVGTATALLAFAAASRHRWVALVALLPTLVFWALDGYYLAIERRYRALFNAVAGVPPRKAPPDGGVVAAPQPRYEMNVEDYRSVYPWFSAARSPSVWPVHGSTVIVIAAVVFALWCLPAPKDDPQSVSVKGVVPVQVIYPPGVPPAPASVEGANRPPAGGRRQTPLPKRGEGTPVSP